MASPGLPDPSNIAAVERYRALLQVSESIASDRDLPELFRSLAALLHRLVTFDFICLTLPDPARKVMRVHVLESFAPHADSARAWKSLWRKMFANWFGKTSSRW